MGKVVKLDASTADRTRAGARGRAAARRRRRSKTALVLGGGGFTGGRLRDRRAAGAGSALGQPHRQPVRRLRRHQRRLVRRRRGGQRRHARGDDAGHRPAGADAVPGRARRLAAEAQLPRVPDPGRAVAAAARRSCCGCWRAISARSRRSTSCSGSPRRCPPVCTRARGSSATCAGSSSDPGPHRRLPAAERRAVPGRHRPRHAASGSCSAPRAGTTFRSPRRSAPRARCR